MEAYTRLRSGKPTSESKHFIQGVVGLCEEIVFNLPMDTSEDVELGSRLEFGSLHVGSVKSGTSVAESHRIKEKTDDSAATLSTGIEWSQTTDVVV